MNAKLLVVEDSNEDFLLIQRALRPFNELDIQHARTIGEFKEKANIHRYDCVIADYKLKGAETGMDVFDYLVSHKIYAPFVILTGTCSDDKKVEILRYERDQRRVDAFVTKSPKMDHLFTEVARVIINYEYLVKDPELQCLINDLRCNTKELKEYVENHKPKNQ
jgi:DNA-binding NtrC family response regulator